MKISNYYMDDKLRQKYANSDKSSHKTKEYREKMSNLKSNYIAQFDLAGNPIAIWDSVNEIHEKLGYTCSVIRCGCNGSKNVLMDIIGDIVIVKEIFLIMVMEIKKNKI